MNSKGGRGRVVYMAETRSVVLPPVIRRGLTSDRGNSCVTREYVNTSKSLPTWGGTDVGKNGEVKRRQIKTEAYTLLGKERCDLKKYGEEGDERKWEQWRNTGTGLRRGSKPGEKEKRKNGGGTKKKQKMRDLRTPWGGV